MNKESFVLLISEHPELIKCNEFFNQDFLKPLVFPNQYSGILTGCKKHLSNRSIIIACDLDAILCKKPIYALSPRGHSFYGNLVICKGRKLKNKPWEFKAATKEELQASWLELRKTFRVKTEPDFY